MIKYRTPESVKKRIDLMLRNGEVVLDHGIGAYKFEYYTYEEPSWKNNYKSKLNIFYRDFDPKRTVKLYMTLTDDNLRKPKKDRLSGWEWGEFIDCYWEKEFPTLLFMREYHRWR